MMLRIIKATVLLIFLSKGISFIVAQIDPAFDNVLLYGSYDIFTNLKAIAFLILIIFVASVITFSIFSKVEDLICCMIVLTIFSDINSFINDESFELKFMILPFIPLIAGFLFAGKIK